MTEQHNPQHWSQLDTEEQIRFWQGIDDGHVGSFLVSPEKKRTRRRRGEHSTKPKCENPSWFRPSHYKALGGQLGHAYNRLVEKDPATGQCRLRMHMSRNGSARGADMLFARKNNVFSMRSGRYWSASAMPVNTR